MNRRRRPLRRLRMQIPYIKQYLDVMKVKRKESDISKPTTYSQASPGNSATIRQLRIITGDRDVLQLVDDRVRSTWRNRHQELDEYNADNFFERWARADSRLQRIVGDTSDNLPGIRASVETALQLSNATSAKTSSPTAKTARGRTGEIAENKDVGIWCRNSRPWGRMTSTLPSMS